MTEPTEPTRFDLGPAARGLADLVAATADEHLDDPTPCADWRVRQLLAHIDGLGPGFTAIAQGGDIEGPDAAPGLRDGWRERIPAELAALAEAWTAPAAWLGTARVGPIEQDRAGLAVVALDELIVHSWDLAVATGRTFAARAEDVVVCAAFADAVASPEGTPGMFGPAVEPGPDATPFERLLASTGRVV